MEQYECRNQRRNDERGYQLVVVNGGISTWRKWQPPDGVEWMPWQYDVVWRIGAYPRRWNHGNVGIKGEITRVRGNSSRQWRNFNIKCINRTVCDDVIIIGGVGNSRVNLSDESRFCLHRSDGRERVWRRPGERCRMLQWTGGSMGRTHPASVIWYGVELLQIFTEHHLESVPISMPRYHQKSCSTNG